jgi:hypothetical protein
MRNAVLLWVWRRLTAPTQRRPEDYGDGGIATTVNGALDGAPAGPAHQALVGESVALAADEVLHGSPTTANTPLGYLLKATGTYVVLSWREDGRMRTARLGSPRNGKHELPSWDTT